jgi:3-hydroxyisobutyrate dehydrogenase
MFVSAAAGRYNILLCDTCPSQEAIQLANSLATDLHSEIGDWVSDADRVWSCVTGDVALAVAQSAYEFMGQGTGFVDLSTASSEDKRSAAAAASEAGVGYADVAIMGAVALTGIATPLLITGGIAERTAGEFTAIGASARAVSGEAGDAAALKLLRTVLTKGVEALAVEAFVAAEKRGVRDELYRVLSDIDAQGFTSFLNTVVRTHLVHAERRMHEVERAITQLNDDGMRSEVLEGALIRFRETVTTKETSPPDLGASDHIDSSVSWLLSTLPARNYRSRS